MKKNYLSKNRDEIDSLYKDLKVAYNEAYKKYGQKNLVGILIHELCHFCFTSVCIKNIKSKINFYLQILYFYPEETIRYLTINFIITINLLMVY